MRELWKKTATLASIGFALGILVGLGFLSITGIGAYFARKGPGGMALYLALSGLLGAIGMGTTTIYDLEHWGLLRCTLTHFIIVTAAYCAVGFTLGWLDLHSPMTLFILAGCVVAYSIIWLIMYLRFNREIRRINEALKDWKRKQGEE